MWCSKMKIVIFVVALTMIETVSSKKDWVNAETLKKIWDLRELHTKEKATSKISVRLVRKIWRPKGFDPGTDEPLNGYSETNKSKLKDLLHERFDYVSEPLISAAKLFDDPNYNASLPSILLTHPMAFPESKFVINTVVGLSLRNLHKHYNVFAGHAPWLAAHFQLSSMRLTLGLDPYIKPIAEAFATFLLEGIVFGKLKPHQINLIGFSYSATLNAFIAREIKDNTRQLIHTLMALDAWQIFKENQFFKPVNKEDAMFVHMIHTNFKFGGPQGRTGTVDIVINNGFYQPGCRREVNGTKSKYKSALNLGEAGCSHHRAIDIFVMSLIRQGNIVARQCDSWEDFSQCKCNKNPILVVSFPVNEEARGKFYLRTTGEYPYFLGTKGAYCEDET